MPTHPAAPEPISLDPSVSPTRVRREPAPLDQLPVWEGFGEPVVDPLEDPASRHSLVA